jgi:hypothetical protein
VGRRERISPNILEWRRKDEISRAASALRFLPPHIEPITQQTDTSVYISHMGIFGGKRKDPDWLGPVRAFCKTAGIEIMAWGPETVVVKAATRDDALRIETELASFDLTVKEDEGDAQAGILTLRHRHCD